MPVDETGPQTPMEDWLVVLSGLWLAAGKDLEQDRLQVYARELGDIPLGLLEKAVSRCLQGRVYSNVPTVGEIRQALRRELGNPYDLDQAMAEWCDREFAQVIICFDGQKLEA